MADSVLARVIIEMMGAPKEHLEETMRSFVDRVRQQHTVHSAEIAPMEPKEQLYSTFVELEMSFQSLDKLFTFCFEALPSHVDILEPSSFTLEANVVNTHINELQARLHELDMAIKQTTAEKQVAQSNAGALFKNLITLAVSSGPKSIGELAKLCGIKEPELQGLLEPLVDSGYVKAHGGSYSR